MIGASPSQPRGFSSLILGLVVAILQASNLQIQDSLALLGSNFKRNGRTWRLLALASSLVPITRLSSSSCCFTAGFSLLDLYLPNQLVSGS